MYQREPVFLAFVEYSPMIAAWSELLVSRRGNNDASQRYKNSVELENPRVVSPQNPLPSAHAKQVATRVVADRTLIATVRSKRVSLAP